MMSRVMVGMTKWVSKAEDTLRRQKFSTSSFITSREEEPGEQLYAATEGKSQEHALLPELCRRGEVD